MVMWKPCNQINIIILSFHQNAVYLDISDMSVICRHVSRSTGETGVGQNGV